MKRESQRKKGLCILLILLLCFGLWSCGGEKDKPNGDTNQPGQSQTGEVDGEEMPVDENAEYNEKVKENADKIDEADFPASEGADNEDGVPYDFGFSVSEKFGVEDAVAKVNYDDLANLGDQLEKTLQTAAQDSLGLTFVGFNDYEAEAYDGIENQVCAVQMEDDDTEKKYFEAGVYHSTIDDQYYHYVSMMSDTFKENTEENLKQAMDTLKKAMGVTLSKARLSKAIDIVLKNANELEDYYGLVGSKTITTKKYIEKITVKVDGIATEDNEIFYYVAAERERTYL